MHGQEWESPWKPAQIGNLRGKAASMAGQKNLGGRVAREERIDL